MNTTEIKPIVRKFILEKDKEEIVLDDINPNLPIKDIIELYSIRYPELINASMENKGVNDNDEIVYVFKTIAGTKG